MWRLKLYGKSRQWQATLGYSTHSMQIMESVRVRLKASVRTSLMNLYPLYSSGSWWRATVSFREGRNMNTVPGRLNCHSVWNGRMPEERLMQFAPTSSRLEILLNILWLLTSGSPILITNCKEAWSEVPTSFFSLLFSFSFFKNNVSVLVLFMQTNSYGWVRKAPKNWKELDLV